MRNTIALLSVSVSILVMGCPSSEPPVVESSTAGPPHAVALYPAYNITQTSAVLFWSVSTDEDFKSYAVLQSTGPEVDRDNAAWLAEFTDRASASYQDTDLTPDTTYYYCILVTDTEGLSSLSNEIDVTTLREPESEPPTPVVLFPPGEVTTDSMLLMWSQNRDDDFTGYTLLRSDSPGVVEQTGTSVVEYEDAGDVSYRDTGLTPETEYYYRVLVEDADGLTSYSNEVHAMTSTEVEDQLPTPASLYPPYNPSPSSLTLTWSVNDDDDFASYTLLRSEEPIADALSGEPVVIVEERLSVSFQDTGLEAETDYYYRIVTSNVSDLESLSNQVRGTTLSEVLPEGPTPVSLGPVYNVSHDTLTLSWTQNHDESFSHYELVRSETPGVTLSDLLVFETTDQAATRYANSGLEVFTEYFYRVWVFDQGGDSIPSNEVSGTTTYDAPPAAVTLADPTHITGTGMRLAWERSAATDFGTYRLYRSQSGTVDQTAELVYQTASQDALEYVDSDLSPNTTYYYRLYVVDTWGIGTGSNIVDGTTLNTEAPRCGIQRSNTWLPVDGVFTFEAVDCEDNLTPVADIQVQWRFGDGSDWTEYSAEKSANHAYSDRGAFWVDLQVFDGEYTTLVSTVAVAGEMVPIEAGTFNMGRPQGTTPWPDMEPQRTVTMDAFHIDTFEVTNAEYAAFLSDGNPGHCWVSQDIIDHYDGSYSPISGFEERPATNVSWYDAVAYCEWAGKQLPTEAQWECAARGPAAGPNYWYPWGNTNPMAISPVPANFADLVGHTVEVESYPNGVTAWNASKQLYQMAGNADEWVSDYYDEDYYEWANTYGDNENPSGPDTSPYAPTEPAYRVTRGGGMANDENPLRVSFRCYGDPFDRSVCRGFRCATSTLP